MTEIHILIGNCGEYSDYHTWVVRGFINKDDAVAAKDELNKLAVRLHRSSRIDTKTKTRLTINKLDPKFEREGSDFYLNEYTVETIPFSPE